LATRRPNPNSKHTVIATHAAPTPSASRVSRSGRWRWSAAKQAPNAAIAVTPEIWCAARSPTSLP